VAQFKYLGTTVTNTDLIQEEIKNRLLLKNVRITIHKTIILPVALYGCETWSLILREGHKLRVFKNSAMRRIFGPKRDKVTRGWTKLHNEELHDLYSSPSIFRMIKWKKTRCHVCGSLREYKYLR
jgi:hypothetical protein